MTEKEDDTKKPDTETLDDEALEKLAVEELMREAVQGAARAEIVGPSGWVKVPQQKTNKRFLVNTLRHAVNSNKYHSSRNSRKQPYNRSPKRDRYPEPSIKKDRPKNRY
ncbi:protein POLR1D-like [Galleria mellonella]|uniref:Protein POLR1D-like n=1 Tax=Galleria mellonella TaxID=7137 RepID=A0A6J1WNX3_GALME|nr:protein POLR1D-like [Galleria mellonella]